MGKKFRMKYLRKKNFCAALLNCLKYTYFVAPYTI